MLKIKIRTVRDIKHLSFAGIIVTNAAVVSEQLMQNYFM